MQPGENGFTISPSMLTRLLAARDNTLPLPFPQQREMGLVLYRPLGIAAEPDRDVRDVVREWRGAMLEDSGRFEVIETEESSILDKGGVTPAEEGMDIDN
jgi:hypothetical protein